MGGRSVVHVLSVYDGTSEELVAVHRLTKFDEQRFRSQFAADREVDPELHERYSVGPDDTEVVLSMLERAIEFDFVAYGYFIEAARDE